MHGFFYIRTDLSTNASVEFSGSDGCKFNLKARKFAYPLEIPLLLQLAFPVLPGAQL